MTAPAPAAPDLPFRPTVGEALHHAVAHWPDRDFVVTPDRHMTYAEAEEESGRLARRMLAAGMGKGTRVGLYFPYGQDWVVAWLAASRIGALVMPLATTYRPAEIRKVLRIGDIDTLLTARVVLGHDMQDMLEASVPGLADAAGPRLFLPETPSLRAVWITGGTDRAPGRRRSTWTRPASTPSSTTCCARWRPRWCPPTSRRSRTRRGRAPTRRASCTRTAPSCAAPLARRAADRRRHAARFFCIFPFFWIGGTLILGAALQAGAPCCHRALRSRRRARPHRGRAGDARDRLAHAAPVDARPPVVRRPQAARHPRAHRRARRPRARRLVRCPASPPTAA